MAKLELTYHQAFPEDGDPGWHAGWMPDGRRVHATPIRCNPGEPHWAGSVEDLDRCECNGDGTCNLCLIRENDGLVFTRVTGCYRSANSAIRALQQWAANPDAPPPPAPFNCSWTTMQAVLCRNEPGAPPMPLGTTEHPMLSSQADAEPAELECENPVYTAAGSDNIRKLVAEESELSELHHLDGFEFTVRPGEDLAITLFRQIAEQQIPVGVARRMLPTRPPPPSLGHHLRKAAGHQPVRQLRPNSDLRRRIHQHVREGLHVHGHAHRGIRRRRRQLHAHQAQSRGAH